MKGNRQGFSTRQVKGVWYAYYTLPSGRIGKKVECPTGEPVTTKRHADKVAKAKRVELLAELAESKTRIIGSKDYTLKDGFEAFMDDKGGDARSSAYQDRLWFEIMITARTDDNPSNALILPSDLADFSSDH